MWSRFRKFLQPPVFTDLDLARRAQNLQFILYGLLLATGLWAWYPIFIQGGPQIAVALTVIALEIVIFVLVKVGKIRLAGSLISTILWLALVAFIATFGGVRNSGFATFSIIVVIAGLTINARASLIFAFLTIAAGVVLIVLENQGMLPPYAYEPNVTILVSQGMALVGISLLLFLTMRNISKALQLATENEIKQKEINELLSASRTELVQRTEVLEQRNITLETVAEVAKLTSQSKSEALLLMQVSQLLANNINLDQVGIFLLDQTEENVILQSSNHSQDISSKTGIEYLMVQRSELNNPLFTSDMLHYQIGAYNYYIQHPHQLAETKTSYTVPLISGNHLLGIINVQTISPTPAQFDERTLETFADQIALSISNIRLFNQLQTRVREISILAGQTMQDAWEKLRSGGTLGYNYDRLQVLPSGETFPNDIAIELNKGQVVAYITSDEPPRSRLAAPIMLRETIIGVIGYEDDDPHRIWQDDEKTLLETVASRVSLALENSRLVAESQRRADQEQSLSQAVNRMRETLDIDSVLKTAVMEIRRTLNAEKAEIRLHIAPEVKKD
jgi:GAF domain-containing protein